MKSGGLIDRQEKYTCLAKSLIKPFWFPVVKPSNTLCMKQMHRIFLTLASIFIISGTQAQVDDAAETGLPGDHFSLSGALHMFKQSENPEAFEKAINQENNYVNNLDLNNDGQTDYVRVINEKDGNIMLFILRVDVSESESQDIAVIELEKTGDKSAAIQIIGDEDIYGEKKIVEPDEASTAMLEPGLFGHTDPLLNGPSGNFTEANPPVLVNVWIWPSVRFVFAPGYRPWVSPWRLGRYPGWWSPWRPYGYARWRPLVIPNNRRFVVVNTRRCARGPVVYTPHRRTSVVVRTRYAAPMGVYRGRTTVIKGPRNNKVIIHKGRGKQPIRGRGRNF